VAEQRVVAERHAAAVAGARTVAEGMAVAGAINRSFLYALGDSEIQE
jgi:hypothetical protein